VVEGVICNRVARQVVRLGTTDPSAVVSGVLELLTRLPVDQRDGVVAALRRGVIFAHPFGGGDVAFPVSTPRVNARLHLL
jgi:hypothetical protein